MIHIDNSSCDNKKKGMPSRAKIAYHWRNSSYQYFDYNMDWGEPSCWACGKFDGSLDIDLVDLRGFEIFKVWENHSYLQRCHIVPKAFGGCNCEANLVQLCRRCHKESPDTRDPKHFINWVRNKKKIMYQEFQNVLASVDYKPEEDDAFLLISEDFKKYFKENSVLIGGETPMSSFIACLMEFKSKHAQVTQALKNKGK